LQRRRHACRAAGARGRRRQYFSGEFNAVVTGGQSNTVDWYVGDVLGGNATVGTITQGNPATYTAPDGVPIPRTVVVRAVSKDDAAQSDSCEVTLTFVTVYVNATTGHDVTGVGGKNKPFKTLKQGLYVAGAGDRVLAAPGVYDHTNGETFPISIPDSVVLEGENWETCIIRVDAELLNARFPVRVRCNDCAIRKFTLEENRIADRFWSIAVELSDCNRALADSLRCSQRAGNSVLRVQHDTTSVVQNCYFVVEDGTYGDRGLEIVFNEDGNGTILRNLTVSGFYDGISFNYPQNTLVENCDLSGNLFGAYLCCLQDPNSDPNPDFGGGARGSAGGNDFSGNQNCGLHNSTPHAIYAMYNTWENAVPVEGTDYCNPDSLSGGDVITE
jgi:hypothetical protein